MRKIVNDKFWKQRIRSFILAVVVGTALAVFFTVHVFSVSSVVITVSVGMILALLGALLEENVGEAVVLSLVVGGMSGFLLWVGPARVANWIGTWAVPGVIGFAASKIVVGLARETGGKEN